MTKTEQELADLKDLVNRFMDAIYNVPFRAVDCDQNDAENLWKRLADAVKDSNNDVKKRYQ